MQHGLKILNIYHRWMGGDKTALDVVPERLRAEPPDAVIDEVYALNTVARIFEFDLGSQAKAKEVYEKIVGMDVSDISKQVARKWLDDFAKAAPKSSPD